jgi:hypothetical protein
MPADEIGVATHGIELEEDFDIVKADRPVRQADAAVRLARDREAEATIDVVKKDKPVAPAVASIASLHVHTRSCSHARYYVHKYTLHRPPHQSPDDFPAVC